MTLDDYHRFQAMKETDPEIAKLLRDHELTAIRHTTARVAVFRVKDRRGNEQFFKYVRPIPDRDMEKIYERTLHGLECQKVVEDIPGVPPVLETEFYNGVPGLIRYGFVPGTDLWAYRPNTNEAFEWYSELAETLDVIHGRGIMHRDIKPENLIYNRYAEKEKIMAIDWGLAATFETDAGSGHNGHEKRAITRAYFWEGTDRGIDHYAAGMSFWHQLTRKKIHQAPTDIDEFIDKEHGALQQDFSVEIADFFVRLVTRPHEYKGAQ